MSAVLESIKCPDCPGTLVLKNSRFGRFYGCNNYPRCDVTHGCHQATGKPLGNPGNKETREARIAAHAVFDDIWQNAAKAYDLRETVPEARARAERNIERRMRTRCYAWLAAQLGIPGGECHFGDFDMATCKLATTLCVNVGPDDIRQWAKERGL